MMKDRSIYIKNIYHMLTYAFQTLNQSTYENVATEGFDDTHNLFAAILSKGIGYQLKQGLYREYSNRVEDLNVMRGKINLQGTMRHQLARQRLLTCEYDELSENNLLNQILKTTVQVLLRQGQVKPIWKDDLRKKMLYFANVETLDLAAVKWTGIRFQRNNSTYRMLLSICQLVYEGLLMTTEKGEYKLASFLDEQRMSRLYEKFILEYYAQKFLDLRVSASQIPWALDDGIGTMLPVMQSDITLQKGSKVLIIDAKYYGNNTQKQFDKHTLHSSNLYQIFTYVKNKDAQFADKPHEVSGLLLYARTEAEVQPDATFQMSGNQISVRTLDLNQPFAHISNQLNTFAEEHFG
jgi:5-methylcytosine-specific restriction enzyme subunit McrC